MSLTITSESYKDCTRVCGCEHMDIHLSKYHNRVPEVINSSMFMCSMNKSKMLEGDTPKTLGNTKLIPIMLDNKSNLQPSNTCINETGLTNELSRKFTPREVFQHNDLAGWKEWIIYKGKVYDSAKLQDLFSQLVVAARNKEIADQQERNSKSETEVLGDQQHNEDIDANGSCADFHDYSSSYSICKDNYFNQVSFGEMSCWNKNGVKLFKIVEETPVSLCVGSLVQHTDVEYWEDLRCDINVLLNDLIGEDCRGTISAYKNEYMCLLQRWMNKYRYEAPRSSHYLEGDLNLSYFPLPEGIEQNPSSLRSWVETWESFDLALPENGAWTVTKIENIEIGNTHEVFVSSLKSHIDLSPFDTVVDGEAAWEVINEGLFADDVMTDKQKVIEHDRKNRANFLDPHRMKKRRESILQYFIDKYRFDKANVEHFLNWATQMKSDEDRFIRLCDSS